MSDKARIIDLQREVRIAKTALNLIKDSTHQGFVLGVAEEALDQMRRLEGLCGHERRKA